jgi:glycosyltransferase involved in cell wall biosynthesis
MNRKARIAFVGGFEPRRCGIATFTHDLCEAVSLELPWVQCMAGAVNDRTEGYPYPPRVRFEIDEKDLHSYRRAADFLNFNGVELLCVQHEFGIYGGPAGSHLLALLKEVRMPVVTTLHTVLNAPDPTQRRVMEELILRSDRLVVMAQKEAEILSKTYGVPDEKIVVIPHGIPDIAFSESNLSKPQFGVKDRRVLLTFGLLGPGKGIEYAIEAMPEIVRKHPDVVYLILGATHPHLLANEGEKYRLSLERLAEDRGVKDHVMFFNRFVSLEDLKGFIGATDIYLTPYLNEAQITSGTLAYVFGAGKAVVSTPYWHAQELLANDRGILVPFRNPAAIAKAVCTYLDSPELLEKTRRIAYQSGRGMIWSAVAGLYAETFEQACAERTVIPMAAVSGGTPLNGTYQTPLRCLDHLERMSDGTGIFQHAIRNVPNYHEGYSIDDNARAYILCTLFGHKGALPHKKNLNHLTTSYLAFIAAALNRNNGRFRNFMSHDRRWLEEAGSEDSHGRTLWALGTGAGRSANAGHRLLCAEYFSLGLPAVADFTAPRAWAFALLGIHEYLRVSPDDPGLILMRQRLTHQLVELWKRHASEDWQWFESSITYENARLCQALILSGRWMPDQEATDIGLKSLTWLASLQTNRASHFRPIGSNGFYVKGQARADFDQQPVEAQAMVSACLLAFEATKDRRWAVEAKRAFEWFLGRNDLGLALYDPDSGGCSDGLHHDRINENQGAESSIAFLMSLTEMNHAESHSTHSLATLHHDTHPRFSPSGHAAAR